MRKRDLVVLLLAAFAVFYSLQHQGGSLRFREAWYSVVDEPGPLKHEGERLPPPIVTDLNGDGRNEVIVATHDAKIQVLEPRAAGHDDESFSPARLRAEVSLLPQRVRVQTGRRPVAMAAGFLTRKIPKARRKQVLVVVTAGWEILCYDHNLQLLWDHNLQEHFPHGAHHKEVAITISNYTMRLGDRGSVIVGGSMEVVPQEEDYSEPEEELDAEEEAHRHAAGEKDDLEDVTTHGIGGLERHFSYYAFEGGSGRQRWHHNSTDFHTGVLSDDVIHKLVPQHNYKLDANSLSSRHFGEHDCRDYRASILASLPHRWDHRYDTKFELAHFQKLKKGKEKLHPGQKKKKAGRKHAVGKAMDNPVTRGLAKVVDVAKKGSKGAEVRALQQRTFYGRGRGTVVNGSGHWWAPNAIVAHLSDGIEVIHLYSGRPICRISLPSGGLHADINGDGVVDHVQVSGGHGGSLVIPTGMYEALRPCWAIATTGTPVREQLFNGSVCPEHQFMSRYAYRTESSVIDVVTPILLPRADGKKRRRGTKGDVVFLTSRGDVTAYDVETMQGHHQGRHARRRWQVSTSASWHVRFAGADAGEAMSSGHVYQPKATLHAMPVRVGGPPEVIVAAGESVAVFLSPNGNHLAEVYFPAMPTEPLEFVDFNNDGLMDFILVSGHGYYGFQQRRQSGALLFTTALGVLMVIMIIILIVQHITQPKPKPRAGGYRGDS